MSRQQPSDRRHMGTAFNPAKTSWPHGMLSVDVDAFVDAVLAELAAMAADGTRRTRSGPKPPLTGAALRKAILAIWCARSAACSGARSASCATSRSARSTRCSPAGPGGVRRLLNRLILAWRQACGDKPVPSAVILDSRSCQSAPTCFTRGFDGGKKIKGIKIHLAVDKYGFPLAINVSPANRHDGKGIVPVLHQLAGFKGTALGDLSYRGQRLSKAGEALGITLQPSAGGHGGTFVPEGIRWVVERSLAWISRYRRLNTIFERTEGHLVAFIEIAFVSILSRRLVRLGTHEISA